MISTIQMNEDTESDRYAVELKENRENEPFRYFYQHFLQTRSKFSSFISVKPDPR
jgi:hypothetical protein